MHIVNEIIDLNAKHKELTGERLKELTILEEYWDRLWNEVGGKILMFAGYLMVDGIKIYKGPRLTPKPEAPYMWGKDVKEDLEIWNEYKRGQRNHFQEAMKINSASADQNDFYV